MPPRRFPRGSPFPCRMGTDPGCIDCTANVLSAARLMRDTGVPYVVVTERVEDRLAPLGVISADDVVTRVLALELDARVLTVGDVLATKAAPAA